jgi:hypothetical protein
MPRLDAPRGTARGRARANLRDLSTVCLSTIARGAHSIWKFNTVQGGAAAGASIEHALRLSTLPFSRQSELIQTISAAAGLMGDDHTLSLRSTPVSTGALVCCLSAAVSLQMMRWLHVVVRRPSCLRGGCCFLKMQKCMWCVRLGATAARGASTRPCACIGLGIVGAGTRS